MVRIDAATLCSVGHAKTGEASIRKARKTMVVPKIFFGKFSPIVERTENVFSDFY